MEAITTAQKAWEDNHELVTKLTTRKYIHGDNPAKHFDKAKAKLLRALKTIEDNIDGVDLGFAPSLLPFWKIGEYVIRDGDVLDWFIKKKLPELILILTREQLQDQIVKSAKKHAEKWQEWFGMLEERAAQQQQETSTNKSKKRNYMKRADANRIAEEKYGKLWRIDNKSEWAREIGCSEETVGKLQTWHRSKNRRDGWKQVAARLNRTVDPAIIEALYTSDASAIGKLTAEEQDKLDALPDESRAEIIELLTESARDAVS